MAGCHILAYRSATFALGLLMAGCSSNQAPAPPPPTLPASLWGDLKPAVSVKELMRYVLDPASDYVFNSVRSTLTKDGMVDIEPKTDADWEQVQIGAVSMAEAAYLLKIKRPFTPPGDNNDTTGPNPVELTPEQITAKVEKDPVEWNARIEALRNASLSIMDIVKRRDVKALWDAGEFLDQACENCHRSFWYPGENAAFYRQLRGRLDEFRQLRAEKAPKPPR